jgi:hypothetical protein
MKKRIVEQFQVRDMREIAWFQVERAFVSRKVAAVLGPFASMVFIGLCHHAGSDQRAWPSVTLLAAELGISDRQVKRSLQVLAARNMIRIMRDPGKHNCYDLVDIKYWATSDCESPVPVTGSYHTSDCESPVPVTGSPPNENNNNTQERNPPTPHRGSDEDQDFCAFWTRHPKKVSKGKARKAWAKVDWKTVTVEEILSGLENAKTSRKWTKNNGEFIPDPSTWLNAEGWKDEIVQDQARLQVTDGKRYAVYGGVVQKDGKMVLITPETVARCYGVPEHECVFPGKEDLAAKDIDVIRYIPLRPNEDGVYNLQAESERWRATHG